MDCGGRRRRRHPRATIWIAIRPEQGHPSSLLPLMVLIAFYDAQEKHAEQWRRGWPDSGGTGETATGAGGRRETGSRKRTAAAIR